MAEKANLTVSNVSIKVTPEILVAKSSEVAKKVSRMRQRVEELKSYVEKTQGYWLGEAGDLHRKLYKDMEGDIEEILLRLAEHPVDLVAIAQKYSDVELQIQQAIEELPGDVIV